MCRCKFCRLTVATRTPAGPSVAVSRTAAAAREMLITRVVPGGNYSEKFIMCEIYNICIMISIQLQNICILYRSGYFR
jgi:hypothetical protein